VNFHFTKKEPKIHQGPFAFFCTEKLKTDPKKKEKKNKKQKKMPGHVHVGRAGGACVRALACPNLRGRAARTSNRGEARVVVKHEDATQLVEALRSGGIRVTVDIASRAASSLSTFWIMRVRLGRGTPLELLHDALLRVPQAVVIRRAEAASAVYGS
jgi:hypothetical protein